MTWCPDRFTLAQLGPIRGAGCSGRDVRLGLCLGNALFALFLNYKSPFILLFVALFSFLQCVCFIIFFSFSFTFI